MTKPVDFAIFDECRRERDRLKKQNHNLKGLVNRLEFQLVQERRTRANEENRRAKQREWMR